MNIRTRTLLGLALALTLFLLAVVHVGWAAGSFFPASTPSELARAVIPFAELPGTLMTLAVAAALFLASALSVLRTIDLRRSPLRRSTLLRIAVAVIASLFAVRAVVGVVVSSGIVPAFSTNQVYAQWDLLLYSPLCLALALAGFALSARSRPPKDLFAHALSVFRRVPFVQLVTLDHSGAPRSRVVMRLRVERTGVVWVATSAGSRKVEDIRRDPRVSLSAFHTTALAMASLDGTAEVVTDPQLLKRHWVAGLKLYFVEGQRDERYVLLRISPTVLAVSDFSLDVTPEPYGLGHVSQAVPQSLPART